MPRLILSLSPGVSTANVSAQAARVAGVTDTVQARQGNAVIVNVDELSEAKRQELADLNGVAAVHDDLQAVPQVADREAEDFCSGCGTSVGKTPSRH